MQAAYEKLVLKNMSPLPLSIELSLVEPFFLCDAQLENSSNTTKVSYILSNSRLFLLVLSLREELS